MARLQAVVLTGLLLGMTSTVAAEDITITTYYPSPRGIYQELRTTDNAFLATIGGRVGIGTTGALSKLDVNGGVAIGSYAGVNAAPANGLIVSGNVGIGTTNPGGHLEIRHDGDTSLSTSGFTPLLLLKNLGGTDRSYAIIALLSDTASVSGMSNPCTNRPWVRRNSGSDWFSGKWLHRVKNESTPPEKEQATPRAPSSDWRDACRLQRMTTGLNAAGNNCANAC